MGRPTAVTSMLMVCLCTSACESVLGSVDVSSAPGADQATGQLENEPEPEPAPPGGSEFPPYFEPVAPPPDVPPVAAADGGVSVDAGAPPIEAGTDAGQPSPEPEPEPEPRPVLVDGPVATLERIGVDGGGPRRGACEPGIVIGVRPTANPSTEQFGQRLTFVEPICGSARADAESGAIRVTRDDALLRWDTSGEFEGEPITDVPDERLIWVPQPETFCPESAPALVGLSGEYDPIAPDSTTTAAIRSLVIECAPLLVTENGIDVSADAVGHQLISRADSFSTSGEAAYRSACDGGAVITQLQLHAGFWLDGFVLGCALLRSPLAAGAACSGDRECLSACAPEGVCVP